MKSKHPINKSTNQINDPLPTSCERMLPPTAHLRQKKKKKKIDPATRCGRDSPQWPEGEIRPPLEAIFVSQVNQKKKKKRREIDPATVGGRDPPQRLGGEIRPPSVAIFVSPVNQKKKKRDRSSH
jgi:hypothetical protein